MTNVVLLVLDTARFETVSTFIDEFPNSTLGSLAADGTTYTNAFATAPWTLPSHASLFTGTYPSRHGAHANHKSLGNELTTLAEVFQSAGYETLGVSNNTWISPEFGFERGFDWFFKSWQLFQTETDLAPISRTNEGRKQLRSAVKRLGDGSPIKNFVNGVYGKFLRKRNDDGAARTNKVIRDKLDARTGVDPFFLFINYLEPHLEYRPPKDIAERFLPDSVSYRQAMDIPQDAWGYITGNVSISDQEFEILRALYLSEIVYLDSQIGELRNILRRSGELQDTVLVVVGDHGENIGDHGLMDHQFCLFDTLVHVPLLISGGEFDSGDTKDETVQLVDIAPTILDAAGIASDEFHDQSQGISFYPNSANAPREVAISEYLGPQPTMSALEERVENVPSSIYEYDRGLRAVRTSEFKYIRGTDGHEALYDLVNDPEETQNVADNFPDKTNSFRNRLDEWVASFDHKETPDDVQMSPRTRERLEDMGYL